VVCVRVCSPGAEGGGGGGRGAQVWYSLASCLTSSFFGTLCRDSLTGFLSSCTFHETLRIGEQGTSRQNGCLALSTENTGITETRLNMGNHREWVSNLSSQQNRRI